MDYKYIEQLMERYWRAETTVEEENILRAFFSQEEVPAEMVAYRPLFAYVAREKTTDMPSDDFDRRILARTEEARIVKARAISPAQRLTPLMKAAAVVAVLVALSFAADFILDIKTSPGEFSAKVDQEAMPADDITAAQTDSIVIDSTKTVSQTQSPITIE